MFQVLTNVQTGGAVSLQQYIDNRNGDLRVGLRSITYTVGWFNINAGESFSWRPQGGETPESDNQIPPGLYSADQLAAVIMGSSASLTLSTSKVNGLITLVGPPDVEVKFTDRILDLFGLDDGLGDQWLSAGIYTGDRPMNFATTKMLNLHLDQINTTANVFDGAPSTLLAMVGLGDYRFGDIKTVRIEHPEFKRFQSGNVDELKVSIRDTTGGSLDNHDLPISVVLEIC